MSHQSGIGGTDELQAAISSLYNSETTRLLKIVINEEKLVPAGTANVGGTWQHDYDKTVVPMLDEKQPCFIFFRLDSQNSYGYEFVYLVWVPDFAHVRQKMVYASTRSTLKTIFGLQHIKDEIYGSLLRDVSFAGYEKHLEAEAAPPPLTNEEIEKAEIRASETGVHIGASTKKAIATGVQFPLTDDAVAGIERLRKGGCNYVQLALDAERQTVNLARAENCDAHALQGMTPGKQGRYHVFLFKHSHEGDALQSLVFIYSCPGYECPVKERMLYSSCKGPLISNLEADLGLEFVKKLEVGEPSDLTHDWLYEQLHPPVNVVKAKFDRPKKPGRGGRRLLRSSDTPSASGEGDDDD
eukprot:m.16491 g.16491  ORF g.16491 m.16491 type:complete len:355 (+) comp6909_c0_seq1:17-1081(+)